MRKRKDSHGCFATLRAVVSAAELPSRESICFRTKDDLRDLLLLLYCALPSMVGVGYIYTVCTLFVQFNFCGFLSSSSHPRIILSAIIWPLKGCVTVENGRRMTSVAFQAFCDVTGYK